MTEVFKLQRGETYPIYYTIEESFDVGQINGVSANLMSVIDPSVKIAFNSNYQGANVYVLRLTKQQSQDLKPGKYVSNIAVDLVNGETIIEDPINIWVEDTTL